MEAAEPGGKKRKAVPGSFAAVESYCDMPLGAFVVTIKAMPYEDLQSLMTALATSERCLRFVPAAWRELKSRMTQIQVWSLTIDHDNLKELGLAGMMNPGPGDVGDIDWDRSFDKWLRKSFGINGEPYVWSFGMALAPSADRAQRLLAAEIVRAIPKRYRTAPVKRVIAEAIRVKPEPFDHPIFSALQLQIKQTGIGSVETTSTAISGDPFNVDFEMKYFARFIKPGEYFGDFDEEEEEEEEEEKGKKGAVF